MHFSDDKWRSFTTDQKSAIQTLRQSREQSRQVAAIQAQLGQHDTRQLAVVQAHPSQQGQMGQNSQILALPPSPGNQPIMNPSAPTSTSSSQTGSAFGKGALTRASPHVDLCTPRGGFIIEIETTPSKS